MKISSVKELIFMKKNELVVFLIILLCCNSISATATRVIHKQIFKNEWHYYEFDMESPSNLTIRLRKISDDVDLYVAREKKPTEHDFLCAPKRSSAMIETCRLKSITPGKWYIGIYGKTKSNYQLGIMADGSDIISLHDVK